MLTSLDFLKPKEQWPPKSEVDRLSRYRDNRALFQGKHEQVFKDWARLLREDMQATMEIILNWPKRLSTLWADLLLGETPRVTAGDPGSPAQDTVEQLIESTSLWLTAYQVALDVSRFGTGLFLIRAPEVVAPYGKQRICIEATKPDIWFPIVSPDNVKDITAHVLAWVLDDPVPSSIWDYVADNMQGKPTMLRVAIHERGKVTNRLLKVVDAEIKQELPLPTLPRYGKLQPVELTGVDDFLVVPVSGLASTDSSDAEGMDDYSDLDSILQELETRVAQVSRILDKHADPNMYGPDTALEADASTGRYVFKGGGRFFPLSTGDVPPGYVVWDGQLAAAFQEIDTLMEQFYMLSETSAAAFGQLKTGLAESGSALRRLMLAPLAKVNRIRMRFDPALRQVLETASALAVHVGMEGMAAVESGDITCEWQDGLPRDEQEATNIETQQVAAGLSSKRSAIKRLTGMDGPALDDELEEIAKEKAAAAPPSPEMGGGKGGIPPKPLGPDLNDHKD